MMRRLWLFGVFGASPVNVSGPECARSQNAFSSQIESEPKVKIKIEVKSLHLLSLKCKM